MYKIKFIIFIFCVVFIVSCNEDITSPDEKEIIIDDEINKDDEIILDSSKKISIKPPFSIQELLPQNTFWNHQFKITLKYDSYSDTIKTNFFFSKRKLNFIEKNKIGNLITYTFLTPGNAVSDSLEIRYYHDNDSVSLYSRYFKVVNSEIQLDSVIISQDSTIKVFLKDYEFASNISAEFKGELKNGFESRYNYSNSSGEFKGIQGNVINLSYLEIPNREFKSFGLRIEAKEEINPTKQIHSYNYFYKSPKTKFNSDGENEEEEEEEEEENKSTEYINDYKKVIIETNQIFFNFDNVFSTGDIDNLISTYNLSEFKEIVLHNKKYSSSTEYYKSKDSLILIYPQNNIKLQKQIEYDKLEIFNISENFIEFNYERVRRYYFDHLKGEYSEKINYKGEYIVNKSEDKLVIYFSKKDLTSISFIKYLDLREYGSNSIIGQVNGYSDPKLILNNDSFIKFTFEK